MREIADRLRAPDTWPWSPTSFIAGRAKRREQRKRSGVGAEARLGRRCPTRYSRRRTLYANTIDGECRGAGVLARRSAQRFAGLHLGEIDAGVCYGGIPPFDLADPSKLRVPMQFHFAERDLACPLAMVERLEHSLKRDRSGTSSIATMPALRSLTNGAPKPLFRIPRRWRGANAQLFRRRAHPDVGRQKCRPTTPLAVNDSPQVDASFARGTPAGGMLSRSATPPRDKRSTSAEKLPPTERVFVT